MGLLYENGRFALYTRPMHNIIMAHEAPRLTYPGMVHVFNSIMVDIAKRAAQQGKTQYLEPLYRAAFGSTVKTFKESPHTPTLENPVTITVDTLLHIHAGMIALMRLTNADELIRWARPNMIAHAEDPDFKMVVAVEAMHLGISHVNITPELYGKIIDRQADVMLKEVGFLS